MTLNVALIGAGAMGGAIGTRLAQTGNRVAVFDPDAGKVAELVRHGAVAAASAADAAAQSDYMVTSLNAPRIVEIAVFGNDYRYVVHRADRQYGQRTERRTGFGAPHKHRDAADGAVCRGAPDADRCRSGR